MIKLEFRPRYGNFSFLWCSWPVNSEFANSTISYHYQNYLKWTWKSDRRIVLLLRGLIKSKFHWSLISFSATKTKITVLATLIALLTCEFKTSAKVLLEFRFPVKNDAEPARWCLKIRSLSHFREGPKLTLGNHYKLWIDRPASV